MGYLSGKPFNHKDFSLFHLRRSFNKVDDYGMHLRLEKKEDWDIIFFAPHFTKKRKHFFKKFAPEN